MDEKVHQMSVRYSISILKYAQLLDMPRTSTRAYGTLSIKTQCIQDWNNLKRLFPQTNLHELSRYSLKSLITKKLINYY